MNLFTRLALVFIPVVWLTGCSPRESIRPSGTFGTAAPASTNLKAFVVKGVIREVRDKDAELVIRHEEIPGYMRAMTMPIAVKDRKLMTGLASNDIVQFKLLVTEDDGWIESIQKIGSETPGGLEPKPQFRPSRPVEELKVGDVMPDFTMTNELGQAVSLHSLKGNAVAITFIFTSCPFPLFCPKMSENFQSAQAKLLADRSAPKNWRMWSVTIDPENDSSDVLKTYAARYKHDPARWSFLTGDLVEITALADHFGLKFWKAGNSISHNLRTVVIDATGKVQAIVPENKWTPDDLAGEIRKAAVAK